MEQNHPDTVEYLAHNAPSTVNVGNNQGQTPLHVAVAQRLVPIIRILLHFGANPLQQDNNGITPLLLAQTTTNLEIRFLMEEAARAQRNNELNLAAYTASLLTAMAKYNQPQ